MSVAVLVQHLYSVLSKETQRVIIIFRHRNVPSCLTVVMEHINIVIGYLVQLTCQSSWLQGLMARIKETTVMLFLLGVLVNCVTWLLSSMLGGTKLSQENILGKLSAQYNLESYICTCMCRWVHLLCREMTSHSIVYLLYYFKVRLY